MIDRNPPLDLIQTELMRRVRHGTTQAQLADLLGVTVSEVNLTLQGKRAPSRKMLTALGIERRVIYVYSAYPLDTLHNASRSAKEAREPELERVPSIQPNPHGEPDKRVETHALQGTASAATLTGERILIAARYRLNPRDTWSAFLDADGDASDSNGWHLYCERMASASAPASGSASPTNTGNAAPVLYGHLKPVNRGTDHRKPIPRGQLPPAVDLSGPIASAPADVSAS